jgi:hypothetical protein
VYARDSKDTVWDDEVEVRDDGRLGFTPDADASSPIEIEAACVEGER